MKRYLLLREERQSGPYTLEDLVACRLVPGDRIRYDEDGEWKAPEAFPELLPYISSLHEVAIAGMQGTLAGTVALENEVVMAAGGEEKKPSWAMLWSRMGQEELLNLAAVFIGMVLGVFVVKKVVDDFVERNIPMGYTGAMPKAPHEEGVPFQNALVRDRAEPGAAAAAIHPDLTPAQLLKNLELKGSPYQVGEPGGIRGLQLTLVNSTAQYVNSVEVELQYFDEKGKILATQNLDMGAVHPHSTKTLAVPPSRKGARVSYKVLNLYSRQEYLYKII